MPERDGKAYRLIIFDADGTLRRCTVPGQPCPNKQGEWELLPMVKARIGQIKRENPGIKFGVASNQAGANPELGFMRASMARVLLLDLALEAGLFRKSDSDAPHFQALCSIDLPGSDSPSRKPAPGMLLSIMAYNGISPRDTIMVGDSEDDKGAAHNACCDFTWAWDFFGWPEPASREVLR